MTKKVAILPDEIKGRFRSSTNPRQTLSHIRADIHPNLYPALLAWLPLINYRGRVAIPNPFPRHIKKLKSDSTLERIPDANEIAWTSATLLPHAAKIGLFLQFSKLYERSLLAGNPKDSAAALDALEAELGVSLWSIENRIFLLQTAEGLERHKAYVNSIRDTLGSTLVGLLTFFASQRNEPTINPVNFPTEILDQADRWEIEEDFKSYLLFRIANHLEPGISQCASILRFEATSSVIDLYTAYVRLAENLTVGTGLTEQFREGLASFSTQIEDSRIVKLLFLDNPTTSSLSSVPSQQQTPYECLVKEDYRGAIDTARTALQNDPRDISIRFVSARATLELPDQYSNVVGLGDRIEELSRILMERSGNVEDAQREMLRISAGSPSLTISAQIDYFVETQFSSEIPPNPLKALKAFVNKPYLDPRDLPLLPSSLQDRYASAITARYGVTPAVVAELLLSGMDVSNLGSGADDSASRFGYDSFQATRMKRLYLAKDFKNALASALDLSRSSKLSFRRVASQFVAHCLLELNRLADAIDFIVEQSLNDPASTRLLPFEACIVKLDKATRKLLAAKLSTPVFYHLYSTQFSDRFDNLRAYAYEDFLLANGIEKPSEIQDIAPQFDRQKLIYYLRRVCTPEIMQVSTVFGGSRELEEERLAVCAILTVLDELNAKEYELEIREITRSQIIQLGVRHVDQSRIFVDLNAIRRWADKNLKERFSRYIALLGAGMDAGATGFEEQLNRVLSGEPVPQSFLELPKNEASELLVEMVSRLLRECMTNTEHGLDCYLSMRVRHGALSGQLRGPLEEEKIITQREGTSQTYKWNEHWMQKLYYLEGDTRDLLGARLAQFSHDYDALIENFVNESIQVNRPERRNGLFVLTVKQVRLRALAADISPETVFEDFVTKCLELFWLVIERNLEAVRQYIDRNLRHRVDELFVNLESDLRKLVHRTATPDFDRAVRTAHTGAQNALKQVIEWFRLRRPESEPTFSFDQMIDIGLQCVKNVHRDFAPRMVKRIVKMPLFFQLALLSDIFFIVFDNIQKHSGLSSPRVEIEASEGPASLKISVRSEVADSANNSTSRGRVERIRKVISEGSFQHGLRSEGGTGLIKLRKIIGSINQDHCRLSFGFTEDRQFVVELELPSREIQV